jgi:hypothetical protein
MIVDKAGHTSEAPSRILVLGRSLATGFFLGGASGIVALLLVLIVTTGLSIFVLFPGIVAGFVVGAGYGLAAGLMFGMTLAVWLTFGSPSLSSARRVLSLMALLAIALIVLLGPPDIYFGLLATPLAVVSTWIGTRLVLMPSPSVGR